MRLACTITSHPGPVPALTITGLEIDQALLCFATRSVIAHRSAAATFRPKLPLVVAEEFGLDRTQEGRVPAAGDATAGRALGCGDQLSSVVS